MLKTYLSILAAILTYKMMAYLVPKVGRWVYFKLPKIKDNWKYNANGDLCSWNGETKKKTILNYKTLKFFFIK